jgi:hypothetical protein
MGGHAAALDERQEFGQIGPRAGAGGIEQFGDRA